MSKHRRSKVSVWSDRCPAAYLQRHARRPFAWRGSPGQVWMWMLLVVVAAVLIAPAALGQEGEPSPPSTESPNGTALDAEAIAERIAELEAQEQRSEAENTELELLKQAQTFLDQAESARKQAAEYQQSAETAPQRLQEIEAELAQPMPDPSEQIPADASLDQLSGQLDAARAQLNTARSLRDELEKASATRSDRRTTALEETKTIETRLEELRTMLASPPSADQGSELVRARQWNLRAEQENLQARLKQIEAEIRSYDARRELLRARRQLAERRVLEAQRRVETLDQIVSEKRAEAARQAEQQAEAERRAALKAHPIILQIAENNTQLASELTNTTEQNAELAHELREVRQKLDQWTSSFQRIKQRVEQAGLDEVIGITLRKQRLQLPSEWDLRRKLREVRDEMNRVQLRRAELEDRLLEFVDIDQEAHRRLDQYNQQSGQTISPQQREELLQAVRQALGEKKSQYLSELLRTYDRYFDETLVPLYNARQNLLQRVREYKDFIDERILWIQSTQPVQLEDLRGLRDATIWLIDPAIWQQVGRGLWRDVRQNPLMTLGPLLLWLALLVFCWRLVKRLSRLAEWTQRFSTDRFMLTIEALGLTLLLSLAGPGVVLLVGWRLSIVAGGEAEFEGALAAALLRCGWLWLVFELIRNVCRPDGLGEAHFRWMQANLGLIRRHLRWFVPLALPLAGLITLTNQQEVETYRDTLGRLAFIIAMLAGTVLIHRVFNPKGGILQTVLAKRAEGWVDRLRFIWWPLLLALPLILAGTAIFGYFYTALQLERRFLETTWLILTIVLVLSLLLRWLFVAQRKLAIAQTRKRLAAQAKAQADQQREETHEPDEPPDTHQAAGDLIEEEMIDLDAVGAQTRSLVRSLIVLATAIGLVWIWADVLPAFNILRQIELWSYTETVSQVATSPTGQEIVENVQQTVPITLGNIVVALFILAVTIIVSRDIPGLLEITILTRLPFTPSARYAITSVTRYALLFIGIALAVSELGFGWSRLQWLIAALGVGLGFGLQEIFANFVSGLIILFERPIRVGDNVTVENISGTVTKIRIRATTITDWDRKELVIPNKTFVTGQIVNWSLSDQILRVIVPVGVAYGSDTEKTKRVLLEVAYANEMVLSDPAPQALFLGFGDSTLNFELRAFISDGNYFIIMRDQLHMAVDAAFRREGITIAFPQRDLYIKQFPQQQPGPG